jgi:arsenite methyltransferase
LYLSNTGGEPHKDGIGNVGAPDEGDRLARRELTEMKEEIKKDVREKYAKIAVKGGFCFTPSASCCGNTDVSDISKKIGYTTEDLASIPEGANLGLGCGNPVALASLRKGETVLDLGSGGGFDCFLAANQVGKEGRVIGVDMTPEMIAKARENALKGGYGNVEFRLGEIENLPVADSTVDAVISNCVINLSPDKEKVFSELFRAMKPGGRFMISDVVLLKDLPDFIKNSKEAYVGCLAGAIKKDEYMAALERAGFEELEITEQTPVPAEWFINDPTAKAALDALDVSMETMKQKVADAVLSIRVRGSKPD